jgi:hypothetical protein
MVIPMHLKGNELFNRALELWIYFKVENLKKNSMISKSGSPLSSSSIGIIKLLYLLNVKSSLYTSPLQILVSNSTGRE